MACAILEVLRDAGGAVQRGSDGGVDSGVAEWSLQLNHVSSLQLRMIRKGLPPAQRYFRAAEREWTLAVSPTPCMRLVLQRCGGRQASASSGAGSRADLDAVLYRLHATFAVPQPFDYGPIIAAAVEESCRAIVELIGDVFDRDAIEAYEARSECADYSAATTRRTAPSDPVTGARIPSV